MPRCVDLDFSRKCWNRGSSVWMKAKTESLTADYGRMLGRGTEPKVISS